jgi:hypothetical protein
MTQGLEHLTPLRVYLRSLEDTFARTAHVRGQGLAWNGNFSKAPCSCQVRMLIPMLRLTFNRPILTVLLLARRFVCM